MPSKYQAYHCGLSLNINGGIYESLLGRNMEIAEKKITAFKRKTSKFRYSQIWDAQLNWFNGSIFVISWELSVLLVVCPTGHLHPFLKGTVSWQDHKMIFKGYKVLHKLIKKGQQKDYSWLKNGSKLPQENSVPLNTFCYLGWNRAVTVQGSWGRM